MEIAFTPHLEPQLESYCQHYTRMRHTRKAMAAAGFPPDMHYSVVANRRDVQYRVAQLMGQAMEAAGFSAERVMLELSRVAFGDIRDVFDASGDLKPIHDLDDDAAATLASVDIETTMQLDADGNRRPVTVKKIKRVDKMAALGLLAKHFKIVGEDNDGVNALASALADRLKSGRKRAFAQDLDDALDSPHDVEDARIIEPATQPTAAAPQETDDEQLW